MDIIKEFNLVHILKSLNSLNLATKIARMYQTKVIKLYF